MPIDIGPMLPEMLPPNSAAGQLYDRVSNIDTSPQGVVSLLQQRPELAQYFNDPRMQQMSAVAGSVFQQGGVGPAQMSVLLAQLPPPYGAYLAAANVIAPGLFQQVQDSLQKGLKPVVDVTGKVSNAVAPITEQAGNTIGDLTNLLRSGWGALIAPFSFLWLFGGPDWGDVGGEVKKKLAPSLAQAGITLDGVFNNGGPITDPEDAMNDPIGFVRQSYWDITPSSSIPVSTISALLRSQYPEIQWKLIGGGLLAGGVKHRMFFNSGEIYPAGRF